MIKKEIKYKIINEIKKIYNVEDIDVALRLIDIRSKLAKERNIDMSIEELFSFLNNAMNYDEMQIWLVRKNLEGIELSFNDTLKKFFELKTDEDILKLYDVEQNYNQSNIDSVKKTLKKPKNDK